MALATSRFLSLPMDSPSKGLSQRLIPLSETLNPPTVALTGDTCHEITWSPSAYSNRVLDARTSNPNELRTTPGRTRSNLKFRGRCLRVTTITTTTEKARKTGKNSVDFRAPSKSPHRTAPTNHTVKIDQTRTRDSYMFTQLYRSPLLEK